MARLLPQLLLIAAVALAACKTSDPEPVGTGSGTTEPTRRMGPGLGNLAYEASELFEVIATVDNDNGVPTSVNPLRIFKPFGTNVGVMHNGYFLTLFASDSGLAGGGLLVYDVSDPREIVLEHRLFRMFAEDREEEVTDIPAADQLDGITGDFREAHSIGFSHIDGRDLAMFHTALGLEIWDLSDMLDPQPFSRLDLPGVLGGDYDNVAWQLSWQGSHAYISGSEAGIYVVDTTDPAAPVLADRGGLPNPIPPGELGGFRIGPLFALGNQLVISSMDTSGGIAVLDISEPAHPTLQSTRTAGLAKFYSTCFSGDRLVHSVRGGEAEMVVHDLGDPYDLRPVGPPVAIPEQLYCATQDGNVFQGAEHELVKVDADFEIVGRGDLGRPNADHGQVSPLGNLVFIGNDHGTGSGFMPHQREPDTTPPSVVTVVPAPGATHQSPASRVGLAFSDSVDNTTLTSSTLELREVGGGPVDVRYAVQGHLVNLAPLAPLSRGVDYEIVVHDGVRDTVGNPAMAFRSTFTVTDLTGGEPGALTLSLQSPDPTPTGVPIAFEATVAAAGVVELSWRVDEGAPWTEWDAATTTSHTYNSPGHTRIFVRATDGVQTLVASAPLTVHRPLAPGSPAIASAIALDEVRDLAWVANRDNGTVARLVLSTLEPLDEIDVGDTPTTVALAADGTAWISLQGQDALASVTAGGTVQLHPLAHGSAPCAAVIDPSGTVWTSEFGSGDLVGLDPTGQEIDRMPVGPGICGLALAPDGTRMLVSQLRATADAGTVFDVDLPTGTVTPLDLDLDDQTLDAEDRSRGVPGFLGAPAISPSGQRAWIPATQANILRGTWRDGQTLTHESTIRAVLPQLDLDSGAELPGFRLDFNDRALPMGSVTTPLGDYVLTALMGSNQVIVVDSYSGATVSSFDTGRAPRSLALSADGTRLFVHAWLDRQLRVYDVSGLAAGVYSPVELATLDLVGSEALDPTVLSGKRLFTDASDPRMSLDGYLSCASCHLDGAHDGLTWDFTERGEGLRNTTDLRGRSGMGHGPVHWTANFDEIQDFENDIRGGFGGAGFLSDADFNTGSRSDPLGDPKAGLSPELDALAAYVASLDRFPASPHRNPDGSPTDAALRGEIVFLNQGCDACHAGLALTDSATVLHDVGTLTAASGQRRSGPLSGLDTPTLRGLWDGGPWLHDGSAQTLDPANLDPTGLHAFGGLGPTDQADLEAYLNGLE